MVLHRFINIPYIEHGCLKCRARQGRPVLSALLTVQNCIVLYYTDSDKQLTASSTPRFLARILCVLQDTIDDRVSKSEHFGLALTIHFTFPPHFFCIRLACILATCF